MQSAKRIIINTIASYGQSVIGIILSLFSARWILQALGQVDFGLFGVVGSLILLVNILIGGMSVGVARFYAFAVGEGKNLERVEAVDNLNRWFNTAFSLYIIIPIVLIAVGWPLGEYAIRHWLVIPQERMEPCVWVFRMSLCSGFLTVFAVPFLSLFRAHQYIVELAVFNFLRTLAVFIIAWNLLSVTIDRLLVYAACMMGINIVVLFIQIARAIYVFDACRVKIAYLYDTVYMKRLFGYVGWKMLGTSCVILRQQGAPVMVNLYYGPIVNAAYSVANRLSMQATTLSSAMTNAFEPAVISAEGAGQRSSMVSMSLQVCKFGSILILIFALPLIFEMQYVLDLWLANPPEHAASLCQCLLGGLIIDRLTNGPMLAINAYGKITLYEIVQGALLLSALPIIWILYVLGYGTESVGIALLISMLLYCVGRLCFAKMLVSYPVWQWMREVMLPILLIISVASLAGYSWMYSVPSGFFRVVITSVLMALIVILLAWFIVLKRSEKDFVLIRLQRVIGRIF